MVDGTIHYLNFRYACLYVMIHVLCVILGQLLKADGSYCLCVDLVQLDINV